MMQGAVKEVEKDNWGAARQWMIGAFLVPVCYLIIVLIFNRICKQGVFSIWRVLLGCVMYAAMTFALANYFLVRPRFSQAYPLFCAFVTILLPLLCIFFGGVFFKKLWKRKR